MRGRVLGMGWMCEQTPGIRLERGGGGDKTVLVIHVATATATNRDPRKREGRRDGWRDGGGKRKIVQ